MDKESKKIKKILLKEDLQTGSKVVSYVYETHDYSLFTTFKENREPDHVGRIANNIIEYGAIQVPIVVTKHEDYPGKLVITDGNNSFNARMQLNLPIPYIILDGATPREMTALNLVSRNWNSRNYIEFYAKLGYPDYIIFLNMLREYDFTCRSMEFILRLSTTNDYDISRHKSNHNSVARGLFKCKNPLRSREIIDFLMTVKHIEGGRSNIWKAEKFVAVIVRLFNFKEFDPERALKKFNACPAMIVKQPDAAGYLNMVEKIYNWHAKKEDLVSFMSIKFRS